MKVNWKTKVVGAVASLAACAMPLAMGVPSALAGEIDNSLYDDWEHLHPISISNVKVSNVTDTTADVTFDYVFDRDLYERATGTTVQDITSVCFVAAVQKTISMTPEEKFYYPSWSAGRDPWTDSQDICTNVIQDSEATDTDAESIYGLQTTDLMAVGKKVGSMTGYSFKRVSNLDNPTQIAERGTYTITLKGLQPSTWYGNKNVPKEDIENYINPMSTGYISPWYLNIQKLKEVAQPGAFDHEEKYPCTWDETQTCSLEYAYSKNYGSPINVDMNQLFLGAHIGIDWDKYNDVFSVYQDSVAIPSFTTAAKGSVSAPQFTDVNSGTPHYEDIEWLAASKISEGYKNANGTYRFEGMTSVYRQDMAAFLRRLAVKNNIADAADWTPTDADWKKFKDVDKNTPHAEDILWLAHAGISEGWKESDGKYTFRGMSPVVRQDMAAFLKRLAAKAGKADGITPVSNFKDVSDTTPHADDIAWLAGAKITEGWKESDGKYTFRGMNSVVRQDMAAFLHRLDTLLNK